jgi:hypothetical protein
LIPSLPLLRKTDAHSAVMTVRSTKTVAVLASVDALRLSKPIEEGYSWLIKRTLEKPSPWRDGEVRRRGGLPASGYQLLV